MLRYSQKTGTLFQYVVGEGGWTWEKIGAGYSGHGEGLNNPSKESVPDVGPIPCGIWSLSFPFEDPHKGPVCFRLTPLTYRGPRTGFLIHGDNPKGDHSASEGCIILDHVTREKIAASKPKEEYLIVEAEILG